MSYSLFMDNIYFIPEIEETLESNKNYRYFIRTFVSLKIYPDNARFWM